MAKRVARKKPVENLDVPKKTRKKSVEGDESAAKKKAKPKAAKRKSRSKKDIVIRQRIAWCVYNHAMKPVAKYAYNQKKAAEKKAKELSPEGKPPHFVAKIKEEIVE